ncbi:MAG: hypothetical protein GY754_21085 [bacterium]|nr:hypothetical protein [bacterium]
MLRPKKNRWMVILFLLAFFVSACSSSDIGTFQQNKPDPDFSLFNMFDGYGALGELWDSVDGGIASDKFLDSIGNNPDGYETMIAVMNEINNHPDRPMVTSLKELRELLAVLTDTSNRHEVKTGLDSLYDDNDYDTMGGFYSLLDGMSASGASVGDDVSTIVGSLWDTFKKYSSYPTDSDGELTREAYRDLMEDVVDALNISRDDFKELSELLGKLLIQSDYPMWIEIDGGGDFVRLLEPGEIDTANTNHVNLGIGNMVKGLHSILVATSEIVKNEEAKNALHGIIGDLGKIFDPTDPDNAGVFKDLICNLEDHFTEGGSVYESDSRYSENSTDIYSSAELGATLREFLPGFLQLIARSDRPHAIIDAGAGDPVYPMDLFVKYLKAIGFNPDTAHIEESIYDLMKVDQWGRDRTAAASSYAESWPTPTSEAWPSSYLETIVFLTHVSANQGWYDGGDTNEVSTDSNPNYHHGHGDPSGFLSLNDGLFSIKTHKEMGMALYGLSFNSFSGHHIYRSRKEFFRNQVNGFGDVEDDDTNPANDGDGDDIDYRFFYDQNYPMMNCMAGPCAGDAGTPTGGNATPTKGGQGNNTYRPYDPIGRDELQLTSWTLGVVVRACMNGEGPYYYEDPDAETVSLDGKTYYKYMRPNGKVYALVNKDDENDRGYVYPTEEGDGEDDTDSSALANEYNGKPQRFNRYRSTWQSDYYMSHYTQTKIFAFSAVQKFLIPDNSSGNLAVSEVTDSNGAANRLTYNELVVENNPIRACASPEEAFYRNFQWTMTEKKMVIIMPLYIKMQITDDMVADILGFKLPFSLNLGVMDIGVVYQVFETNGFAGLGGLRKFGENHVWAKTGESGTSDIPGDYRLEVVSHTDGLYYESLLDPDKSSTITGDLVNDAKIYDEILDCGQGNPSIVSHCLPGLYRLGFPRSPNVKRVNDTITDRIVGSRELVVGSTTWNNRNAVLPIMISLVSGLHEYTGTGKLNRGIASFSDGLSSLIKPIAYYQRDSGTYPRNTLKTRVYGSNLGEHSGDPALMSAAEFYSETPSDLDWYGSEDEMRHYQPAELRTPVNLLIDSDPFTGDLTKRCDGVLSLLTKYNVNNFESGNHGDSEPSTRVLTNLFKVLMADTSKNIYLEQLLGGFKFTKGELTSIYETNYKDMDFPGWMFATASGTPDAYGNYSEFTGVRKADIVMDGALDAMVGHDRIDDDNPGMGLAAYPDDKTDEVDWADFNDLIGMMGDLLNTEKGAYPITENLINMMDAVLVNNSFSEEELAGLLYTLGKLMAYYDGTQWVYQGQEEDEANSIAAFDFLYRLQQHLPQIHDIAKDDTGDNYYFLAQLMGDMTDDDGLVTFIADNAAIPSYGWEEIIDEIYIFLGEEHVTGDDASLWSSLEGLMGDMFNVIHVENSTADYDAIFDKWGFQVNK